MHLLMLTYPLYLGHLSNCFSPYQALKKAICFLIKAFKCRKLYMLLKIDSWTPFFCLHVVVDDLANRHLGRTLRIKNARLTFEVANWRVELSYFKDKASICEELKCKLKYYKNKLFKMWAQQGRTMTKMHALVDKESH